jgi:hypothetical protein
MISTIICPIIFLHIQGGFVIPIIHHHLRCEQPRVYISTSENPDQCYYILFYPQDSDHFEAILFAHKDHITYFHDVTLEHNTNIYHVSYL